MDAEHKIITTPGRGIFEVRVGQIAKWIPLKPHLTKTEFYRALFLSGGLPRRLGPIQNFTIPCSDPPDLSTPWFGPVQVLKQYFGPARFGPQYQYFTIANRESGSPNKHIFENYISRFLGAQLMESFGVAYCGPR